MQAIISEEGATTVQVTGALAKRTPSHVQSTYGDGSASKTAMERDVAQLADLRWMRGMQTSAVMGFLSDGDGSPDLTAAAFDDLCSGAPDRLVLRRDVATSEGASSVQTMAWAGAGSFAHYGLVDFTLVERAGRRTLRTQDSGIYWTRHAVERRYERFFGKGSMGLAMARELAPHRTLLRLVVREAARLDMPHVPVPLDHGMLFGTLRTYDWVPVSGSVCVEVTDGRPVATGSSGSCVAADGNRWTGLTYVTDNLLRPDQVRYANLWRQLLGDPAVAHASKVLDWDELADPAARAAFAQAEASLNDRIRSLLLMAVRGHGRDLPRGN